MFVFIQHININGFLGICLESPNSCILMSHATRGSLNDVLNSDEKKLTWDFKLSISNDIANGMKYLHSSPIGTCMTVEINNDSKRSYFKENFRHGITDYVQALERNSEVTKF